MYNFAFAKIGKSIKFKRNNYSAIGGDNEPSNVLIALANHNPDKKFYIVGRSDFSTLSKNDRLNMFPYDNVVDIFENVKATKTQKFYDHVIDYFKTNKIKIDYGIMMVGQIGTVTIPGRIKQIKNDNLIASVIDMTKMYTTPTIAWLNDSFIPYIEIVNDPRYVMNQSRDNYHLPTQSIGQYDFTYNSKVIRSYEDQTLEVRQTDSIYAGMEKAFCITYDKPIKNRNRNTPFMIVLNEGKPSRYNLLKEWVLEHNTDVEIYGQWDEDIRNNDLRFRGSLHIDEIQKKLNDVKCTLIIPIAKGWVTSKYIEMIHAGVVPFFHPTYDEQNHLDIPDFFRPDTPIELQKRIHQLTVNQEYYEKCIEYLQNKFCTDDVYSGQYINNQIMSRIISDYTMPDLSQYETVAINSLDSFFD
jgi:hypothetical protein